MSTELVSQNTFGWFLTALTGGLAGTWLVYDAFNFVRALNADRSDPVVRDKQFGYVIGMIIGVIGVVGCLKYQGVL
jgi:hypothetical protein